MKWAVKNVIMYTKFVKAVAREYSLRLETLRRNVILARQGAGGEEIGTTNGINGRSFCCRHFGAAADNR